MDVHPFLFINHVISLSTLSITSRSLYTAVHISTAAAPTIIACRTSTPLVKPPEGTRGRLTFLLRRAVTKIVAGQRGNGMAYGVNFIPFLIFNNVFPEKMGRPVSTSIARPRGAFGKLDPLYGKASGLDSLEMISPTRNRVVGRILGHKGISTAAFTDLMSSTALSGYLGFPQIESARSVFRSQMITYMRTSHVYLYCTDPCLFKFRGDKNGFFY